MGNLVKLGALGVAALAGYYVGFYEMKYKAVKFLLEAKCEQEAKNSNEK